MAECGRGRWGPSGGALVGTVAAPSGGTVAGSLRR